MENSIFKDEVAWCCIMILMGKTSLINQNFVRYCRELYFDKIMFDLREEIVITFSNKKGKDWLTPLMGYYESKLNKLFNI